MGMLRFTILLLILSVIVLIPYTASAQDAQSLCTFQGIVQVNGQAVEEGTEINAFIEGDKYSTTAIVTPGGNSTYRLEIAPPLGTEYAICTPITFMIGNLTAAETGSYAPGYELALDLTATEAQRPCVFHGTVLLDGEPVDTGTVIKAIYGLEDHIAKTALAANGTSIYSLNIVPPEDKVYEVGDAVTFVIGVIEANETGIYEPGGNFTLNLTAEEEEGETYIPTIALILIITAVVIPLTPLWRKGRQLVITKYLLWLSVAGLILASIWLFSRLEWNFTEFPGDIYIPLRDWVDSAISWITTSLEPLFDFFEWLIRETLVLIGNILVKWLPWWAVLLLFTIAAWLIAGRKVAILVIIGLFFIGTLGRATHATSNYWDAAQETLTVMLVAVLASIIIGIPIGIIAGRSDRFEAVIRPVLDAMQTMPSFVYLIPAVMIFSLGKVPAVLATFIYAIPPCIRLTNLGIRQVSEEVVEAGKAFGSTPMQILLKIQLPLSLPTIMAGITQTIMLALAMVVIASMIGAGGLGLEVLRGLETRDVGRAFVSGLSIVILAIILDRIGQHIGQRSPEKKRGIFSRIKEFISKLRNLIR